MPIDRTTASGLVPLIPSPLERLLDQRLVAHRINLYLKRDDLIHPEIPGNKWRKLKFNLDSARRGGFDTLLTFGGAYSNHIRAVAGAGHYFGFKSIGLIRGEEHRPLNWSLAYAVNRGMKLDYLDRTNYRNKNDSSVIASLRDRYGEFYLIPEGGSNDLGVLGCAELPPEIQVRFDTIACPCGTGGTLAGVSAGLPAGSHALGFSALRGGQFLSDDVAQLQQRTFGRVSTNWTLIHDYHFGGFARRKPPLDDFIADFRKRHGLLLDWLYVAKMMYGIFDLVEQGRFDDQTIVTVITGPDGPASTPPLTVSRT